MPRSTLTLRGHRSARINGDDSSIEIKAITKLDTVSVFKDDRKSHCNALELNAASESCHARKQVPLVSSSMNTSIKFFVEKSPFTWHDSFRSVYKSRTIRGEVIRF